ncbi:MAG TPA: MarR family transcriptional regulator [Candidatus Butyricicoccus stercorigallinarum]|nr:MarR family transcriptional regulator [Candidatus Butyricicoccus stercorigallinarum]
MSVHEQIHTFLVEIFGRINKIEQRALSAGLNDEVTIAETHILEKIGDMECARMSDIARALDITLATLTIACERLEKKGMIERVRAKNDRRVVLVSLTPKGWAAYRYHRQFHNDLIDSALSGLTDEEQRVLSSALKKIEDFLGTF